MLFETTEAAAIAGPDASTPDVPISAVVEPPLLSSSAVPSPDPKSGDFLDLSGDGGVLKRVTVAAPAGSARARDGDKVQVLYVGYCGSNEFDRSLGG